MNAVFVTRRTWYLNFVVNLVTKYPTASSGKNENAPDDEYNAARVYQEMFLDNKKVPREVCGDAERVALKFLIHWDEVLGTRAVFDKTPPFETTDATVEATDAEGGAMRRWIRD